MRKLFGIGALIAALAFAPAVAWADTQITTANESDDTETDSGDATAVNSDTSFTGQAADGDAVTQAQDIEDVAADNVQEGDNAADTAQSANADSGDTVGGQVIGAVSSGDLNVDATNSSEDVDAESGDATAENFSTAFVGLASGLDPTAADIDNVVADNVQEGDNGADLAQSANANTGDAVGGQVFGAVASGMADVALANSSIDADVTSGDADEASFSDIATGLVAGVIEI